MARQRKSYDQQFQYIADALGEWTGSTFTVKEAEIVFNAAFSLLMLRDIHKLGNYDTRDQSDEINAILPRLYDLLAMHDLYEGLEGDDISLEGPDDSEYGNLSNIICKK